MRNKQQVMVIHGGSAYSSYHDFLEELRTRPIEYPAVERPKGWRHSLQDALGEAYAVYLPSMPNADNAHYIEWKIWFERYLTLMHDGAIVIGHSQGGYFLAKYLTENTPPIRIARVYLVAAPIEPDDFGGEDGGDFAFDTQALAQGLRGVDQVFIVHSTDDTVVVFEHAEKYMALLPQAELLQFTSYGHFIIPTFPELVAHLTNRTKEG